MRLIISISLAVLLVSCGHVAPARAQANYTVVATCGTPPATFLAGAVRTGTMDTSGRICSVAALSGGGDATAANQVLQITQETAFNTALGAVADAACATDNGTCSTIALVKRTNQRLTTVNTTLGTPMQATGGTVGLVAGSAIVGNVRIDQTTPGTTNGVQVNAALPAGSNVIGGVTAASGSFASGSQPIGITPTDRTVTSATGSSQTVMSALATRKSLLVVNTGNANCGVNPTGGTAVIGGAGTITLTPTGSYSPRIPTLAAVTAICTAGQPLYAEES